MPSPSPPSGGELAPLASEGGPEGRGGVIAHAVGDVVLLRKTTGGGVPPPYGRTDRLVGRGHALAVTVRQDRASGASSLSGILWIPDGRVRRPAPTVILHVPRRVARR